MKEIIIIIYDVGHQGIICSTNSSTCAYALISGSINARSLMWSQQIDETFDLNFNDPDRHHRLLDDRTPDILPEEFATTEWKNFRTLMLDKKRCLEIFEFKFKKLLSKNSEYFDDSFFAYLNAQLIRCSPDSGYYTPAIFEYAEIQKISVERAYQELLMKVESRGILQMRNYATYISGIRSISEATAVEGSQTALRTILSESNYSTLTRNSGRKSPIKVAPRGTLQPRNYAAYAKSTKSKRQPQ